jgi:hypothetical protein
MRRVARRQFLATGLAPVGASLLSRSPVQTPAPSAGDAVSFRLSRDDETLLEDLERRSFRSFWEQGEQCQRVTSPGPWAWRDRRQIRFVVPAERR